MPIITIEDFRKAVKAEYEIVKEGEYSNHFNPPSPANLRKLCLKKFRSITNKDDLDTFFLFFGFEFDGAKKNLFKDNGHKFKPVGAFFKGETINPTDETVYFAAILVDFQPRPFNKFKKSGEIEEKDHFERSNDLGQSNAQKKSQDSKDQDSFRDLEKEKNKIEAIKSKLFRLFLIIKERCSKQITQRFKKTVVGVLIVLFLGFIISYYTFPKRECMTWVKDHYEKHSVSSEGYCDNYYDPRYFNLKKIKVCDTTTFFKNGKPVVFYSKSGNSIECFNQFAPHPENPTQYLKPITQYMIAEYVSNKPCK